jgi:hypothetical protein
VRRAFGFEIYGSIGARKKIDIVFIIIIVMRLAGLQSGFSRTNYRSKSPVLESVRASDKSAVWDGF